MPKWLNAFLLLLLFETVADVLAKSWERTGKLQLAFAAQLAYFLGNLFWLFALVKGVGMARGGVLFSVSVAITAVIVGMVGGEKVSNLGVVGLILGLIAIGILSLD